MIVKRIIENWKESYCSDLRQSVKPCFKGDRCRFSSYRSGAETYMRIDHKGVKLVFCLELGRLEVSINGIDARESPLLAAEAKNKLKELLSSKQLAASERNRQIAQLISNGLSEQDFL